MLISAVDKNEVSVNIHILEIQVFYTDDSTRAEAGCTMVSEVLGNSTSLNIINIINIITSDVTPSLNSFQIQVSENIWLSRYLDINLQLVFLHLSRTHETWNIPSYLY